jgi:hypothetical protein
VVTVSDGQHLEDRARGLLGVLSDETMTLAWGPASDPEERRRTVLAALLFGEEFEKAMDENPPRSLEDKDFQRFLMGLMNAVVRRFAGHEGIPEGEAATFLGAVGRRDRVLELNEAIEAASVEPGVTLDERLREAVEERSGKAVWSRHWKGGERS